MTISTEVSSASSRLPRLSSLSVRGGLAARLRSRVSRGPSDLPLPDQSCRHRKCHLNSDLMEILDMTPLAQVLVHFTNDDLALDTPEPMTGLDLDWILDS